MEAPIVKDGGFNCQRWRLQLSKMEAPIIKDGGFKYGGFKFSIINPPFFSSLLGSLILATSLLFLL